MSVMVELENGARVKITESNTLGVELQFTNPKRFKPQGTYLYHSVASGIGVFRILKIWEGAELK